MWNSYGSFLDYLELRRRVERHLASPNWLALHTTLFVVVEIALARSLVDVPSGGTFAPLNYANPMWIWSLVLLAHGLWTFARSGAWRNTRSRLIETEMRDRLRNGDTFLIQDERDLFRLHGLLEEDIRTRGSNVQLLAIAAIANAIMWVLSGGGYTTPLPWQTTTIFGVFVLLPLFLANIWRLGRRERRLMKLLSSDGTSAEALPAAKTKRDMRWLSDDGEVLDIIEEDEYEKPKRAAR